MIADSRHNSPSHIIAMRTLSHVTLQCHTCITLHSLTLYSAQPTSELRYVGHSAGRLAGTEITHYRQYCSKDKLPLVDLLRGRFGFISPMGTTHFTVEMKFSVEESTIGSLTQGRMIPYT